MFFHSCSLSNVNIGLDWKSLRVHGNVTHYSSLSDSIVTWKLFPNQSKTFFLYGADQIESSNGLGWKGP